jgi:membrane protease YdiL (CAAX protease family)
LTEPIVNPLPNQTRLLPAWRDLILYLVVGVGGYIAASLVVEVVLKPTKMTLPLSVLSFLLNVLFIGGSVVVVGAWRKRLDLKALGFFPPRLDRNTLALGVLVSLAILPVRGVVAVVIQQALGGRLDSTQLRLELIAPEGFTWLGFFLTLLGAGILAPIAEELFFRGALLTWFRGRFNFPVAMVVTSLLFGLAHIDTAGVVASSFIFGLAAAFMFERTKTLWVPIMMHITSNAFAVCFLYFALARAPELLR